jgi:hypothetical protein
MRFRSVFLLLLLLALPHRAFSPYADFTSNPTDTDPNSNNNSNSSSLNLANSTATTRTFLRDIHELSIYTGQSFGYPLILSDLPGQRLTIVGARLSCHFIEFHHTTLNYNFDLKPLAIYSNDIYGPRRYTYGVGFTCNAEIVPHNHFRCKPVFPSPKTRRSLLPAESISPSISIPASSSEKW